MLQIPIETELMVHAEMQNLEESPTILLFL